jgi:glycosyltransferase involved in cell wall biosynthesis
VLFPGDYEFSFAARTVAAAAPRIVAAAPDATIAFACRIKREPSRVIRDEIARDLAGLEGRVAFLDEVPDMPALVGASDVVLLPSESLYAKMDVPIVLLEAMSQRIPLVLADVPPLDELLATGAGLGVRPADPEGLANAVHRILTEEGLGAALGAAGERAVAQQFSAESMAHAVEKVYDELLQGLGQ